ncbi:hypothetical protein [Shinella zoogloeoides]|uniref:hypothetical protein n=1 Tax=Shinella zoogloeoides TaxID=352475 RepID=UPI00273E8F52|nr:hypothetical protein [Shinella zoogloeoides]WLR92176.1 hypothetical protein Q9316_17170 [Shinella zoogloeoides]
MKYVVVGDCVRFGVGQALMLSDSQIAARRHALEDGDKKNKVVVITSVEFKRGEVIGLADKYDDLPRSLSSVLEPESKVDGKPGKPAKSGKPPKAAAGDDDLDALEKALEDAEDAVNAARATHGIPDGAELTDEQCALMAGDLERLRLAKEAFDAAIGE